MPTNVEVTIRDLRLRAGAMNPVRVQRIVVAGRLLIELRYESIEAFKMLSPALAHLTVNADEDADANLIIDVLSGEDSSLSAAFRGDDESAQPIDFIQLPECKIAIERRPLRVSVLASAEKRAVYWCNGESSIRWHERSCPLRHLLHWWLSENGAQLMHAASIAREDGGVLIIGRSGAGKSTTALSCLSTGFKLIADDLVLADYATVRPNAHALFSTLKIDPQRLQNRDDPHVPDFIAAFEDDPARPPAEKSIAFLRDLAPDIIKPQACIKAILLNEITHEVESSLRPVSTNEVLSQVSTSAMEGIVGPMPQDFFAIYRIVKATNCYFLRAGNDRAAISRVISELLESSH